MRDIVLLKQPAFVYDLLFVFWQHFNEQRCRQEAVNLGLEKLSEDCRRYVESHFGEIPDDLYLFFISLKGERCFMTSAYFVPYRNRYATDYSAELLIEELADTREVVCRVIKHHFPLLSRAAVEEHADSLPKLFGLVKESAFSDYHKTRLYEFFGNPSLYVDMLIAALREKLPILQAYYDAHYEQVLAEVGQLDRETLRSFFEEEEGVRDAFDRERGTIYISICALYSLHVSFASLAGGCIFLFGKDFRKVLAASRQRRSVKLDRFSLVVGDESRVRILDYILEKGEVTCKDLEHNFNFSGSTAYHHLIVMTRIGAISTRHIGKTVLYSLNKAYFTAVSEHVAKYGEK